MARDLLGTFVSGALFSYQSPAKERFYALPDVYEVFSLCTRREGRVAILERAPCFRSDSTPCLEGYLI